MFKYTTTEFMQNPHSFGGNWDSGSHTAVSISKSPKRACALKGAVTRKSDGVEGVPIMSMRRLEKNGKTLWEIWD